MVEKSEHQFEPKGSAPDPAGRRRDNR